MNRIRLTLVMTIVLTLLLSGGVLAAQADYDFGYDEGKRFFGIDSSFDDGDDAFDEYLDYIEDDDPELYDEIDSLGRSSYNDFQEGFIEGYNDAMEAGISVADASSLGESLGRTAALTDYYDGNDSDWRDALPSDRNISRMFDLDRMSTSYEKSFISDFKSGFQKGYEDEFQQALLSPPMESMSQGLDDGEAAGEAMGASFAEKDYLLGSSMNYERDLPRDSEIIERYRLRLGTNEYRDAFVEGFKKQYQITYNETFRSLHQDRSMAALESTQIPTSGGEIIAADGIGLLVEPGTFYMPVYVTINQQNTGYYRFGSYIRASEIYSIKLDNPAATLDDNKKITIAFPYYGEEYKAGIYKLIDERWQYIPSKVEGDAITAQVLPSTMSNREGTYAVFMDENIRILTDVRDHWAKPEIETMVRRSIITGYPGYTHLDGTFKPSQSITRAEFLILLSRIENWTLPNYIVNATHFKDHAQFAQYDRIISYALSRGYVIGYTDGTFRPNNPISYYEVQLIMGRVQGSYGFNWNSLATQMMYEKAFRSPSFD
ncbi:MAG TPA: S-layer homology domain-containing protein, partial [Tissierellaceae bacterium]|nr:S-layer homology domain-containing protein [Tissierellaceae bacterium]